MKYTQFVSLTVFLAGFLPQAFAKVTDEDLISPPFFKTDCEKNKAIVYVDKAHTATIMCGDTEVHPASDISIPSTYTVNLPCSPQNHVTIEIKGKPLSKFNTYSQYYTLECTRSPNGHVENITAKVKPTTAASTQDLPLTYTEPVNKDQYGLKILTSKPDDQEDIGSLYEANPQTVVVSLDQQIFLTVYGVNTYDVIPITCTAFAENAVQQGSSIELWSLEDTPACKRQRDIVTELVFITGQGVTMSVYTMKAFQFIGETGPVQVSCHVRICTKEDKDIAGGKCIKEHDAFYTFVTAATPLTGCTFSNRKRRSADKMQHGGRIQSITARMIITEDLGLSAGTWNYASSLVSGLLLPVLAMVIM